MVGIWLGALAYMNAASEEFEEAKEETLDNAPKEDIAILTEIRAAESALVAAEALTEEAREAWEAAAAAHAAEAEAEKGRATYMDVLHDWIGAADTSLKQGAVPTLSDLHGSSPYISRATTYAPTSSGLHQYYLYLKEGGPKWPEASSLRDICQYVLRGRPRWECFIPDVQPHEGSNRVIGINIPEPGS